MTRVVLHYFFRLSVFVLDLSFQCSQTRLRGVGRALCIVKQVPVKHIFLMIFLLFSSLGGDIVSKFQGNESAVDHFKLVLRDGNSLLVGGR